MQHRIRLSDADLDLLIASLRARRAMVKGVAQREHLQNLVDRFVDCTRGNPHLVKGGRCVDGVPLAVRCDRCRARSAQASALASLATQPTSLSEQSSEVIGIGHELGGRPVPVRRGRLANTDNH